MVTNDKNSISVQICKTVLSIGNSFGCQDIYHELYVYVGVRAWILTLIMIFNASTHMSVINIEKCWQLPCAASTNWVNQPINCGASGADATDQMPRRTTKTAKPIERRSSVLMIWGKVKGPGKSSVLANSDKMLLNASVGLFRSSCENGTKSSM